MLSRCILTHTLRSVSIAAATPCCYRCYSAPRQSVHNRVTVGRPPAVSQEYLISQQGPDIPLPSTGSTSPTTCAGSAAIGSTLRVPLATTFRPSLQCSRAAGDRLRCLTQCPQMPHSVPTDATRSAPHMPHTNATRWHTQCLNSRILRGAVQRRLGGFRAGERSVGHRRPCR